MSLLSKSPYVRVVVTVALVLTLIIGLSLILEANLPQGESETSLVGESNSNALMPPTKTVQEAFGPWVVIEVRQKPEDPNDCMVDITAQKGTVYDEYGNVNMMFTNSMHALQMPTSLVQMGRYWVGFRCEPGIMQVVLYMEEKLVYYVNSHNADARRVANTHWDFLIQDDRYDPISHEWMVIERVPSDNPAEQDFFVRIELD